MKLAYRTTWIDIRVVRAPEYDGWAAVDKTGHCWAEENVPKEE